MQAELEMGIRQGGSQGWAVTPELVSPHYWGCKDVAKNVPCTLADIFLKMENLWAWEHGR